MIRPTRRSISSRSTLVLLDLLARGHRDLDEDGVLDVEVAVGEQLGVRAEPGVDALGVVEPVDAEEDLARVAERAADLLGAGGDLVGVWASSSKPAASMEIGNAAARTVRPSGR